jgi:hypothetical protein
MSEQLYSNSNYRFSDPIRFFKANDPYYFEIDNIPLKQLQENCLWLRDQIRKNANTLKGVKRVDIDELRPYANGGDRKVRVLPGRYTARVNDASHKEPLAYLRQVMGTAVGDVDAWGVALPNSGSFPDNKNAILEAALDKFKSKLSQDALGMNGLEDRAFTWPVVNSDFPVDLDGVDLDNKGYAGPEENIPGGSAYFSPRLVTQALLWAKSQNATTGELVLPSFEITNTNSGWAKYPRTESFFVKAWRGIARNAIVDVGDELSIEVPAFDATDFSYIDENGGEVPVPNVESRIDMVFIYSKPVDASSVDIHKASGRETITAPTLGIVRGAGIKANLQGTTNPSRDYIEDRGDSDKMLASPGDTANENMGFTATSSNDVAFDIRGSFPAPDDIMNIAPLISEKLEDEAIELVGQSILPVAYVWVQNGSQVVLSTDVIDIRPMFRTAELSYNERAGIAAAMPQLSLANPAVGKGQLDYELKRVYDTLNGRVSTLEGETGPQDSYNTLATGYVFGGYFFGPEAAMFDFFQTKFGQNSDPNDDSTAYIKNYIANTYGFAGPQQVNIPDYPDWDLANWCVTQNITDKGQYCNDYMNQFYSNRQTSISDDSIAGGSMLGRVTPAGLNSQGGTPERKSKFDNHQRWPGAENPFSSASFLYVSKTINFDRPSWLLDYQVDVDLTNCVPQTFSGGNSREQETITYHGHWVEKGQNSFTIYVAFTGETPANNTTKPFPAPFTNQNGVEVISRGDSKFTGGFAVPVSPLLYDDAAPVLNGAGIGYQGSPRIGVCAYPTVSWRMTGIPFSEGAYHYGNLNGTNPTITLKNS